VRAVIRIEQADQESGLVIEIGVDRAVGYPRRLGDVFDRGGVKAFLGKDPCSGVEDVVLLSGSELCL
jgi:hypothetical protein